MIEDITNAVIRIIAKYSIKRVTLFGSRVEGTHNDNSDVDLIIEFNKPVSLLTLSMVQIELGIMGERRCLAQIISNGFMKWSAWDVVINILPMEVTSGRENVRNVRNLGKA